MKGEMIMNKRQNGLPSSLPTGAPFALPGMTGSSVFPPPPMGLTPTTPAQIPGLSPAQPAFVSGQPAPQTLANPEFLAGFLRTQIGRRVRVEFLIGTNSMTDRTGTLVGVGVSYILIQPLDSDDIMLCDLYSIRFVTFIL